MPTLKESIDKLLRAGYSRTCIKQRLRLQRRSANEVETIAGRTPRALAGVYLGCKADRGAS
jgi:hypothetical protein